MEVRSLAQCLRSRPASSLLASRQPSLLQGQPFHRAASLRYASTNNGPSNDSPSKTTNTADYKTKPQSPTKSKNNTNTSSSDFREFDTIFSGLNLQKPKGESNPSTYASPVPTRRWFDAKKYREEAMQTSRSTNQGLSDVSKMERGPKVPRVEFKLCPELGRQVIVEPERGIDLNNALRRLNMNLSANRVRSQKSQQKFHIRRGQMRKNLKSSRWRRLFKFSFAQTVAKVQRMKAQGW